jgi:hypothetical protein
VVIDIVLPAMLGLVLVREAGVEAYSSKVNEGNSNLRGQSHLPAGQDVSNLVVFLPGGSGGSSARTSHELEGLSLTLTVRHGCDNGWRCCDEEWESWWRCQLVTVLIGADGMRS